jgi:hypothetical protein
MSHKKNPYRHREGHKAKRPPVDSRKKANQKAGRNARWAIIMTKVRISRLSTRVRWEFATFRGPAGGEAVGVIDLLAVRKDFSTAEGRLKLLESFI